MVDKQQLKGLGDTLALNLGKVLAEQRKRMGWTQAKVAEKVGVDTETISRFERGTTLPSLKTLEILASSLNTTSSNLLSGSSPQPNTQAELIVEWLGALADEDRIFVVEQTKQLCQHLKKGLV